MGFIGDSGIHQFAGLRMKSDLPGYKQQISGSDGLVIRTDWSGCIISTHNFFVHAGWLNGKDIRKRNLLLHNKVYALVDCA
jgi:hypothetical protein